MKKSKSSLFLLSSILFLTSCGGTSTSSTSSTAPTSTVVPTSNTEKTDTTNNSNSNAGTTDTTSNTTTTKTPDPTDSLTEAMYADYKLGYSASYVAERLYVGDTKASYTQFDVESTTHKFKYSKASKNDAGNFVKYGKTKYYWAVEDKDGTLMTMDASLGLDNKIWLKQVTEEDTITNTEFDLEWEYSYYENVLANFDYTDFTKKDSNTFVLSNEKTKANSDALKTQLYSPYSTYLPSSDVNYFALKTDGDSIVGFELTCETYTSSSSTATYSCSGTFTGKGANAYTDVKTITNDDNPELDSILNELKVYNWKITQTQSQYDYNTSKMNPLGTMYITVGDNGDKEYWEYYNTNGKRTQSYGYKKYVDSETNTESKLGIVKIGDYYYEDMYLYTGTMSTKMPSFNMSSKFFKKDTAASINGKIVYTLDESIEISDDNVTTGLITPETMRQYDDRIVHLTITKNGDTITLRNSTSNAGDESTGLIMNCEYSNIGGVTNFMDDTTMKSSLEGLKWSDLIERNEENYDSITATFGKDNLDSIPLVDDKHANIYVDHASKGTTFYFTTYDLTDMNELFTEYKTKLANAGFTAQTDKTNTETDCFYVKTGITIAGSKGRTYTADLVVEVTTWWNSIQKWGQFQVTLTTENLKSVK